jgi:choice-of-anchor A domain-containing protein
MCTQPLLTISKTIFLTFLSLLLFKPASSQNPTSPAQGFNVFLLGNATPINNETEGSVAMGGDLILAGSYQVSTNFPGTYTVSGVPVTLLVGGKIIYQSGNGITINQNGYIKIGNCTGSTVWYTDQNNAFSPIRITSGDYNGSPRINLQANSQQLGVSAVNNPVCQSGLIDFTSAFTLMKATSTSISTCTDNANLTNPNGITISHTGLPNQVKIRH